jgi:hypothetical protein
MKKIFLIAALAGIFTSASASTVISFAKGTVVTLGGDEKKGDDKKKSDKEKKDCCKKDAKKKECAEGKTEAKSCSHADGKETKSCCKAKAAEVKPEEKK